VAFRDDRAKAAHLVAVIDQRAARQKIFADPVTVLLIEASLLAAGE
jgi:hypothetical protein